VASLRTVPGPHVTEGADGSGARGGLGAMIGKPESNSWLLAQAELVGSPVSGLQLSVSLMPLSLQYLPGR
jgi:hypothetical protein